MESFVFEQKILFRVNFLSVTSDHRVHCFRVGSKSRTSFFNFFFLNGIIQFKQQALFRIDFLSVTSDWRVQYPRVGLEFKI